MNSLIESLLLFLIPMTVLIVSRQLRKDHWKRYLISFILLWFGIWFFSSSKATACEEYSSRTQQQIALFWENYDFYKSVSPKTRLKYLANANWHSEKAYEEFNLAKEKCWLLPNFSNRERLKKAWAIFMLQVPAATPLYKALIVLLALLTEYGSACIDEWHDIKELLESSQENAEMAQFYRDLANQ